MTTPKTKALTLQDVTVEEWNKVTEYYCKSHACIETRMVQYDKNDKDILHFKNYAFNFHVFRAEEWKNNGKEKVHSICGSLDWKFDPKECPEDDPSPQHQDIILEWVPEQFLWESPIGDKNSLDRLQVLCGNVIGYTLNVLEFLNEEKPRFFQWNRPDAPKDNKQRKWLMQ